LLSLNENTSEETNMKRPFSLWLVLAIVSATCSAAAPMKGPLRVHPQNPRYFTDGSGKAIYLTGSHTWSNLQDQGSKDRPPRFDYGHYLDFLREHNHNFIRMWAWEQARWAPWSDGRGKNPSDWFIEPNPYCRTGPGLARDGKPKFDLAKFDPAYFERLRERVQRAGERGIYVSVMLFQGWSSAKGWLGGRPWLGHPYHPDNNIQGFNGNRKSDVGPDLSDPQVRGYQAAYVRKVVDTVNDLDNVLYEVTNEGGTKDWDWWVVRTVQDYEKTKAKQHPVGLTGHGSESNEEMLASPAAWISPGSSGWRDLTANPRPAPGTKVSLLDTDHVFGVGGDQKWVWKGFLRGHNVLFMDPYDDPEWAPVLTGQKVGVRDAEAPRRAMGVARSCAERLNLADSTPNPELASTGFCLAVPGKEYLVYLPEGGNVKVDLSAGKERFSVEWMHPITGKTVPGGSVDGGNWRTLNAPFRGDAVLYLRADGPSKPVDLGRPLEKYYSPPAEYVGKYGAYRSPLKFADGTPVKSPQDWARRRQEILAAWHKRLGPWPPLLDRPAVKRLESVQRDGHVEHHVHVQVSAEGNLADGYLLIPAGSGPFPAVLVPFYEPLTSIGQGKKGHGTHDYGLQLVRRGFVTLSIGTPGSVERIGSETRQLLVDAGMRAQRQPLTLLAYAAANCHTVLAQTPGVDPSRIGIIGLSYGGKWSMFASCLYDKFACAVWSDPGIVFNEKNPNVNYWEPWYLGYDPTIQRKPGVPSPTNPRTGLYKELVEAGEDLVDLHALMAPRPVLVSGGTEDPPRNWQALNHLAAVNELLGHKHRVAMTARPTHVPTPEALELELAFLEYWLKGGAK